MSALSLKEKFIKLIATGFYSSALPPWPGTSGTIPPWLFAWFLIKGHIVILAPVTIVTIAVSVWSTGAAEKIMGHDSRFMVMDEWAGMFIALLFVPYNITNYLIAFFAFRLLDAIKPYPVKLMEKAPGGWGVTFDDIGAGIQANLVVQLYILVSERFI